MRTRNRAADASLRKMEDGWWAVVVPGRWGDSYGDTAWPNRREAVCRLRSLSLGVTATGRLYPLPARRRRNVSVRWYETMARMDPHSAFANGILSGYYEWVDDGLSSPLLAQREKSYNEAMKGGSDWAFGYLSGRDLALAGENLPPNLRDRPSRASNRKRKARRTGRRAR